jgi:hypothetical protein
MTMDEDLTVETVTETEPRRRGRAGIVTVVIAGLLLVGAATFAVIGFQASSEASDQRDAAATATHERHELTGRAHAVEHQYTHVKQVVEAMPGRFTTLGRTVGDLADAQNHFVDVTNHGADLYNQNDVAGALSVYRGDAVAALDDMTAKHDAATRALKDAQAALQQLQEVAK